MSLISSQPYIAYFLDASLAKGSNQPMATLSGACILQFPMGVHECICRGVGMNLKVGGGGGGLNHFKFNCARLPSILFCFTCNCVRMGTLIVIFHEVVQVINRS